MSSPPASPALDPLVAQQAAEWFMDLQSPGVTPADRAAFERWRGDHPEHDRAWQRALRVQQRLELIPNEIALPTLGRGQRLNRRVALKTLALLITAAPAGWLAYRELPWREWTSDQRTAVGEQREITLADGSRVHLNTATAIDIRFDARQRRMVLHDGEILIETAADPAAVARPFVVDTLQGRIRALGTRFIVRQDDGYTQVTVLEHAVEIRPHAGRGAMVMQAGQQTRFSSKAIDEAESARRYADAWTRGILHADAMTLGDFVSELGRYRSGVLRCDPAVANLRVSGAFQLRNTDPVLNSLPAALPVRIVYHSRWWVSVVAATPPSAT